MSQGCRQYPIDVLADLAAGRLSEAEAAPVRDHVAHCNACRKAIGRVDELQRALINLPQMKAQPVAQTDHARIMHAAADMLAADQRRQQARRLYLRVFVPLAAAVLALIIGVTAVLNVPGRQAEGPVVAGALYIEGPVTIGHSTATAGQPIRAGQQVQTGPDGRLRLALTSGGTIELNQQTVLLLERPLPADVTPAEAQPIRMRLERGEIFADATALAQAERLELAAFALIVSAGSGAQLNMRVEPLEQAGRVGRGSIRGLFGYRGGGGGASLHLPLAIQGLPELGVGHGAAAGRMQLTVLAGPVRIQAAGGQVVELQTNERLAYDTSDEGLGRVSTVRAERFALWQMPGDELLRMAEPLLPQLLAGKSRLLDNGQLELRYDWSLPSQLRDWQVTGLDGAEVSIYRGALRLRSVGNGRRGRLVHVMAGGGPVELSYELTTDPRQDWRAGVGIELRPQNMTAAAQAPLGAFAAFHQRSDDRAASAEFSLDGSSVAWRENVARLEQSSVPVQGLLGDGRLRLMVAGSAVVDRQLSDELSRSISVAGSGRGHLAMVYLELQGQDVFVDDIVIRGRADPRWLRSALGELLEHLEQNGR